MCFFVIYDIIKVVCMKGGMIMTPEEKARVKVQYAALIIIAEVQLESSAFLIVGWGWLAVTLKQ